MGLCEVATHFSHHRGRSLKGDSWLRYLGILNDAKLEKMERTRICHQWWNLLLVGGLVADIIESMGQSVTPSRPTAWREGKIQ